MTFQYNPNIPNGPNSPSADQPLMQNNFNSLNAILGVDHYSFGQQSQANVGNIDGRHRQVSLPNETSPGVPAGTNTVLYSALYGTQNVLFQKNVVSDRPTNAGISTNAPIGLSSIYGGAIVQWGFVNGTHSNNHFEDGDTGTVTFPIGFYNAPFIVLATACFDSTSSTAGGGAEIAIDLKFLSQTVFKWKFFSGSNEYRRFFWYAIGY